MTNDLHTVAKKRLHQLAICTLNSIASVLDRPRRYMEPQSLLRHLEPTKMCLQFKIGEIYGQNVYGTTIEAIVALSVLITSLCSATRLKA
jgi:hypothetical protein